MANLRSTTSSKPREMFTVLSSYSTYRYSSACSIAKNSSIARGISALIRAGLGKDEASQAT